MAGEAFAACIHCIVRRSGRKLPRTMARALSVVLLACSAMPANAQSIAELGNKIPGLPEPSIAANFPRDFGDPGGVRSALAGKGITYGINYTGEVLSNPTGGFAQGAFYNGRLELQVSVDLEKSVGWKGLTFFADGFQIHGRSLTASDLGALMPVSYLEAFPTTRLFELWLEQKLLADMISVRFGQLSADSEFALSESSSAFLNASWGWPSILGANLPEGGPSYPMASPGMRVSIEPNETLGFLVGVFSSNPAGNCADDEAPEDCNPYGVRFPLTSPLLMGEVAIRYNQGEGELSGKLKLGAWRDFGSFVPGNFGNNGLPIGLSPPPGVRSDNNYGVYAIIDQMIYRLPGPGNPRGISLFGSYMHAPPGGNIVQNYIEAGVTFMGLSDLRPHDVFGLGVAYSGVSSQIIDYYTSQDFAVVPSYEAVFEASYIYRVMQGLYLQPDFQYFWNPGGHVGKPDDFAVAVPNAVALSFRATINY